MPSPLLTLRGVSASYGPLPVLFGVDFHVEEGERLALLGTNGAGKSTVLRVAMGLLAPTAGAVLHRNEEITGLATERRSRRGITLVAGGRATCPGLSVRENLALGAWPHAVGSDIVRSRLDAVLELFPPLGGRLDRPAGVLSGGEQQMMAIGRAMMSEPELLMIDELSLGLAPATVGEVVGAVRQIADRGVTLLLVEQSLNVACAVCDRAVFLEKGEVRFSGPVEELTERGDLARSVFFGTRAP